MSAHVTIEGDAIGLSGPTPSHLVDALAAGWHLLQPETGIMLWKAGDGYAIGRVPYGTVVVGTTSPLADSVAGAVALIDLRDMCDVAPLEGMRGDFVALAPHGPDLSHAFPEAIPEGWLDHVDRALDAVSRDWPACWGGQHRCSDGGWVSEGTWAAVFGGGRHADLYVIGSNEGAERMAALEGAPDGALAEEAAAS